MPVAILDASDKLPVPYLAALFYDVDWNCLATFEELDHYPNRRNADYWGSWQDLARIEPVWAEGDTPRVFAYLKPCPALSMILSELRRRDVRGLVFLGSPNDDLVHEYATDRLRFSLRPINIQQTAAQCDCAITHGGHATTAALLCAGKPVFLLPFHMEQTIMATNVVRMGAGVSISPFKPEGVAACLDRLIDDEQLYVQAGAFAKKNLDFDPATQIARFVDRIEELTIDTRS